MKHLRLSILVLTLLGSLAVHAQDVNLVTPPANPIEDQALDMDFDPETLSYNGFNLFLGVGTSFDSNSVSSSGGTTTSLDPSTNIFYASTLNWRSKDAQYSWHLRYKHTSAEYRDIPSVTPDLFKYNKDIYNLWTKYRITNTNFYVGVGVYYYSKKLSEEISQPVLVDQTFIGPTILVGSSGKISSVFNWEADLFVNMPFLIEEPNLNTGRYSMGIMPEANFRIIFPYTKLLDLALGLNINFDYMKYKGTGSRSLTDASETGLSYAVPFELRFRF